MYYFKDDVYYLSFLLIYYSVCLFVYYMVIYIVGGTQRAVCLRLLIDWV